jgi:putative membrane protein
MMFPWQAALLLLDHPAAGPLAQETMPFHLEHLLEQVLTTVVFTVIGLAFFALSDFMIERVMPKSIRKEIHEDQNVALAIVIASVVLGIAIIVSAAIR